MEWPINIVGRELPKCVWTSWQTASFLDVKIVELHPELFHKACKVKTSKIRLNFTEKSFVFGRTNRGTAPTSKPWTQTTSKMLRCFTTNSFVFGRTSRGIAPSTSSAKLAGRNLPKCVWISRQTASFLDAQIGKMRPELFFTKLERRKGPKCDWTSQQAASFSDT